MIFMIEDLFLEFYSTTTTVLYNIMQATRVMCSLTSCSMKRTKVTNHLRSLLHAE